MEPPQKRVLCVGLCCLDIVMVCKSYPVEDSDQRCESHKWQRGGNASNNCTIFAEFNIPCEILGALSLDFGGEFMKRDFEKHNICFENCHFYEDCDSVTACIWINSKNGSRTIVCSNKNMPEVTFEDFKALNLDNYKWIHFEGRRSIDEIAKMVFYINSWNRDYGDNNKIRVSIEIEKPDLKFRKMLKFGDVVFVSKDFAVACGYNDMTSAVQFLSQEIKKGSVIICPWGDAGVSAKSTCGPIVTSAAYSPTEVINTLSAGDSFVAAAIISLMKGDDVKRAIEVACRVAGTKCGMNDVSGLSELCPFL